MKKLVEVMVLGLVFLIYCVTLLAASPFVLVYAYLENRLAKR